MVSSSIRVTRIRQVGRKVSLSERAPRESSSDDTTATRSSRRWTGRAVTRSSTRGVAQLDGETLLLVRVEDRSGISHLGVARSADGLGGWTIEPDRALLPDPASHAERFGIEDPRITQIGDEYLIVYTGYSTDGPLIFLAVTRDFREYDRRGVMHAAREQGCGALPAQVRRTARRCSTVRCPSPPDRGGIWLSLSPDLRALGRPPRLLAPGEGGSWESHKIGLGPPAARTPDGWLLLYHGVRTDGGRIDLPARARAARRGSTRSGCSPARVTGCSGRRRRTSGRRRRATWSSLRLGAR